MEQIIPLITVACVIILIQSGLEKHTTIILDTRKYYLILGKRHFSEDISLKTFDYSRYGVNIISCLQFHDMYLRHFKISLRHISCLSFRTFWGNFKIIHYQLSLYRKFIWALLSPLQYFYYRVLYTYGFYTYLYHRGYSMISLQPHFPIVMYQTKDWFYWKIQNI